MPDAPAATVDHRENKMLMKKLALAGGFALSASTAMAACSFENDVPIRSLSAGFEAWKAVTDAMAECGNVQAELDQEFRNKQPAAFEADPSLYHIGGVSNGTITPLLNAGTIRPLDDLVEKYGQNLSDNQLIRVDGEIVAIAMMVNTQHLMFREDIMSDLELEVPQTYDEVLEVAAAIQEAGVVDYPLGATMQSGWNLAQDFNNMFLGYGGDFYDDDSTPAVNSEAGIRALETMKALTDYMDPEYLVGDSTYVQQQMQQGRIAMTNLWASRAGAFDDEAESDVVGLIGSAAAPVAMEGGPPATTLWWDGIVIAANIPDEEADAAFRVAMEGMDREMVEANNDAAIWLIEGYQPSDMAAGAIATATASPPPASYPSTSQMGLMHTALGNELPAFFTGERTAEQALAAVEEAYTAAAQEAGLIQ
jgi:ABC-type glycerol-3-phosphate transport system substrate-binding protein